MIEFQKYKFRKYNKNYPKLFLIEKRKLLKIFPKNIKIEHIGSSAVPGLGGKGMIDLAISIQKNKMSFYKRKLDELGFQYKTKPRENERLYFEKSIINKGKERKVALHLTDEKSPMWREFIIIREALRNNKKLAKEYVKIKKEALKYAKGNGKKYLKYKQPFLRKVIKKYQKP